MSVKNLSSYVICAKSQACSERAHKPGYVGWYDAGGVLPSRIVSTYYGQYRHRFVYVGTPLALDHDFIAFKERTRLTEPQRKAILACLNSTLGQVYLETFGRTTGGGMISMEAKHAEQLRIPHISGLSKKVVHRLADAFDALDRASRKVGGANDKNAESALLAEYGALDEAVGEALNLTKRELSEMKELWEALRDRRVMRTSEPSPESIIGEDTVREGLTPPRRSRRSLPAVRPTRKLDEFR